MKGPPPALHFPRDPVGRPVPLDFAYAIEIDQVPDQARSAGGSVQHYKQGERRTTLKARIAAGEMAWVIDLSLRGEVPTEVLGPLDDYDRELVEEMRLVYARDRRRRGGDRLGRLVEVMTP